MAKFVHKKTNIMIVTDVAVSEPCCLVVGSPMLPACLVVGSPMLPACLVRILFLTLIGQRY